MRRTFTATSRNSAVMSYTFTDGSNRSGAIPLTRLTPNVTCSTAQARPTNADFARSGNSFCVTTASTNPVGTATLDFASCGSATFTYNFTGGANAGQAGTIALTRVGPVPAGCA